MIQSVKSRPLELFGKVVSGLGRGAEFTELHWAKKQFIEKLGIDPHPGTLNIQLNADCIDMGWRDLPSYTILADSDKSCDASCYPIFIANQYTGAIVVPLVDGYPANQLEIIAPVPLRQKLSLHDDDLLEIE